MEMRSVLSLALVWRASVASLLIPKPIPSFDSRHELPLILQGEGHEIGVELGVHEGAFATHMLRFWPKCRKYVLVDLWGPLPNYVDLARADQSEYDKRYATTLEAVKPWGEKIEVCRNTTVACAHEYPESYFDFVYVDARHTRKAVLADLNDWWPRTKRGGLICGHDYMNCNEASRVGQDWCIEEDGTRDLTGGAVKGAVQEFADTHHRQIQVGSQEITWGTWCLRR